MRFNEKEWEEGASMDSNPEPYVARNTRRRVWLIAFPLGAIAICLWFTFATPHGARMVAFPRRARMAKGDYLGREEFSSLFTFGPKPTVIPHAVFFEGTRKVTPVNPADVCVVSIDSADGAFLGGETQSAGDSAMLSALGWALRHGYQYRRLARRSVWQKPRYGTWLNIPPLLETIKACKWTVYRESDVFFNEQSWSLDDMRLAFGIHDDASIYATNEESHTSYNGTANMGFLIVRQTPKSITAFEKLQSCVEDTQECDIYRFEALHEQGAFERFIAHRYLIEGEDYIRGDCDMTNGYFGHYHSPKWSCTGKIVGHFWYRSKDLEPITTRLAGLDMMRSLLELFHEEPDLRAPFTELKSVSLDGSERVAILADVFRKSDLSTPKTLPSDAVAIDPSSVCVVAADGRVADAELARNLEGWPSEVDGTMATSLVQMAYALRHGYSFRRIRLPPFPELNINALWHAMEPLLDAVERCEWTLYFSQSVYPTAMHENIDGLLQHWEVPSDADFITLGDRSNSSNADMSFALIRRSQQSLRALELIVDCQDADECLQLAEGTDPHWAVNHLKDSFNKVVRPMVSHKTIHVVPHCTGPSMTGCMSELYVPPDWNWFFRYGEWSNNVSRDIANLLGKEVLKYLSVVWETFDLREQPFASRA